MMPKLNTGPIDHDQLYDEVRFIQEILAGAGVRTVTVCCAFGVEVDHPLFAKLVRVRVEKLAAYLRGHEASGAFHFGQTNITLTTELQALEFFIGNDHDIFCEGEDSEPLRQVSRRWAGRYLSIH
jgi:hypothetical protein